MPVYNSIQGRTDLADQFIPPQEIAEIIQEVPKSSTVLARARRATLSSNKAKQPVLATLPTAYWVNGDTGLKQTTKATWDNVTITVEELAAIVPIPDALIADSNVPLWAMIRPLLAEAIGAKIDEAVLFGIDKPNSWPDAIVSGAIAAGNTIRLGTGADLGVDVASLGQKLAKQGFNANGFVSEPGLQWQLVGLRNANGDPIYQQSLSGTPVSGLYGYPLNEVTTGVWDTSEAVLLAADWNKFIAGIRQDITYDLFSEGVISDDDGKVILNLMQQDTKALRVVFRVGFQTAIPATRLGDGTQYPAGVILPALPAPPTPPDPDDDEAVDG